MPALNRASPSPAKRIKHEVLALYTMEELAAWHAANPAFVAAKTDWDYWHGLRHTTEWAYQHASAETTVRIFDHLCACPTKTYIPVSYIDRIVADGRNEAPFIDYFLRKGQRNNSLKENLAWVDFLSTHATPTQQDRLLRERIYYGSEIGNAYPFDNLTDDGVRYVARMVRGFTKDTSQLRLALDNVAERYLLERTEAKKFNDVTIGKAAMDALQASLLHHAEKAGHTLLKQAVTEGWTREAYVAQREAEEDRARAAHQQAELDAKKREADARWVTQFADAPEWLSLSKVVHLFPHRARYLMDHLTASLSKGSENTAGVEYGADVFHFERIRNQWHMAKADMLAFKNHVDDFAFTKDEAARLRDAGSITPEAILQFRAAQADSIHHR